MNERVRKLREESFGAPVRFSAERARLLTEFHREQDGLASVPVTRARAFAHLCEHRTLHLGAGELIVGERGPEPKAVPSYPEITCHSVEDLEVLRSRERTPYRVSDEDIAIYRDTVIPYWRARCLRERLFAGLPEAWHRAYGAGLFTEFMEQRAPGHTTLDGKLYVKGLLELQDEIDLALAAATPAQREQLAAMRIAAGGAIRCAERHAELAERRAAECADPARRAELLEIAAVCRRVPAHAPRSFHEALQAYWFVHLGTITELNGWDAMNPGHLDQHLQPFFERELAAGTLTRERARELLGCFWIKFNNQPAPPKVGVTAAESGTYNDFTNINLGGLRADGGDGASAVSGEILAVADEIHLLQPQFNLQLSRETPEPLLREACRTIAKGYGYPSLFNADGVVAQLVRQGKSLADAREGGNSGCVESGAFGKEAYFLTGYINTPKLLELALNRGVDPRSGERVGPDTGDPRTFADFDALFAAFVRQLEALMTVKLDGNRFIESVYAAEMPAPFLSLYIDDCIAKGRDYNAGGARYNTSYVQGVGIGSITDALSAIATHVFAGGLDMDRLLAALAGDFAGEEALRQTLANRSPRYGNDDPAADAVMERVFEALFAAVDGEPNARGGRTHLDMLPTTCHIYFGAVTGASADGRHAGRPLSEGISPVQGADRKGPTAVLRSAARMDQSRTGGTLLNMKFLPALLADETGRARLAQLVRAYFRLGGHHLQFNVVDAATLRHAQAQPEEHRDLIVRVAGYSDYFVDIGEELQEEIIARRSQGEL